LLVELAVLAALIVVLAALGPFGSYAAPFRARLLHWTLYLASGYIFFRPVVAAGGALARQTGLPRFAALVAACAFGAFPTSLAIVLASAESAWRSVSAADLLGVYAQTLIVGATVTVVQVLANRNPAPAEKSPADLTPLAPAMDPLASPVPEAAPAFLALLPAHLRGEVLCLENEDHYVRVHTEHGSAMILMRMRDAAAQLEGKGARVHRSWWVARAAVAGIVRDERNFKLRLVNAREVPVARANVPELRALGWLAGDPPA